MTGRIRKLCYTTASRTSRPRSISTSRIQIPQRDVMKPEVLLLILAKCWRRYRPLLMYKVHY